MKFTIAFVLAFVAVAFAQKYTDKYDSINFQEILNNDRLFEGYKQCLLDDGPCTAEGKELKSHIQDALENGCAKCTDTQQDVSRQIIKHLVNKKKEAWTKLTNKYDPTGKFAIKYEKEYKEISA